MDDARTREEKSTARESKSASWLAKLQLIFACEQSRTFLAKKQHLGPLVVQKSLHPEGDAVCHAVVIHPPGGVAGGDQLELNVRLQQQAHALLTTPGAGKWYKANNKVAKQQLRFDLAEAACLEWFPQENILFNGADVQFAAEIKLGAQAVYAGWDITCLGRQAQQEQWLAGAYRQGLKLYRGERLIWHEAARFNPQSALLDSKMGLGGRVVFGSFMVTMSALPAEVLSACRALRPDARMDASALCGMTQLPEVLVVRYVGQSAQAAKHYFEAIWQLLRPVYAQKEAYRPRIWNT